LRTHLQAGRLTVEEFEDRAGEVYGARTIAQLVAALRDLPPLPAVTVAAPLSTPPEGVSAVLGTERLTGRWRVPEHLVVRAILATAGSTCARPTCLTGLCTSRRAVLGDILILVPEGANVR
jgi:Domain of unknown function (DUF1707)